MTFLGEVGAAWTDEKNTVQIEAGLMKRLLYKCTSWFNEKNVIKMKQNNPFRPGIRFSV